MFFVDFQNEIFHLAKIRRRRKEEVSGGGKTLALFKIGVLLQEEKKNINFVHRHANVVLR